MSAQEMDKLFVWAHKTFGLVLHDHQKKSFASRFEAYLNAHHIDAKHCLTELENNHVAIKQDMVDLLTVQESYFFRDQSLFVFLTHHRLPMLIKNKRDENNKKIRIWSVGCSEGQELYSLAILLVELIPDLQTWDIELLGTDINHKALRQAERACYSKFSLRATDNVRKNNYFKENNAKFELILSIKNMAKFCYGNLIETPDSIDNFDLIFCRNVFIYLDPVSIEQGLSNFETSLSSTGALFLGPSDFIHYQRHNFFMHLDHGVTYYDRLKPHPSTAITHTKTHKKPYSFIDKQKQRVDAIQEVQKFLKNNQFEEALDKINGLMTLFNASALLYRYKGEALIGLGELSIAQDALEMAIKKDAMDAKAYVLYALVLMAENPKQSEAALQKAVYLNQHFVEAHYHLAMLYLGQGLTKEGVMHLKKSKAAAKKLSKDAQVMGYNGNIGYFLTVLDDELRHYLGCSS